MPFPHLRTSAPVLISYFFIVLLSFLVLLLTNDKQLLQDSGLYLGLLSALITLGTFLPPLILTIVNFEEAKIAGGKLIWKGLPMMALFVLIFMFLTDIILLIRNVINPNSNNLYLIISLTILTFSTSPFLLVLLSRRLRPEELGNIFYSEIKLEFKKSDFVKIEELLREYIVSILADARNGKKSRVSHKLTSLAALTEIENTDIREQILDAFGWIAREALADRDLIKDIEEHLLFVCFKSHEAEQDSALRDQVIKELTDIFEWTIEEEASNHILLYTITMIDLITNHDLSSRVRFLRRYARIATLFPERATFIQKYLISWLEKQPEILNEDTSEFKEFLLNYKWEDLEIHTRSRNYGYVLASDQLKRARKSYLAIDQKRPEVVSLLNVLVKKVERLPKHRNLIKSQRRHRDKKSFRAQI